MQLSKHQDERMNEVISDLEMVYNGIDIGTREPLTKEDASRLLLISIRKLNALWSEIHA